MNASKMIRLAAAALCLVLVAGPVRADIDNGEDLPAAADAVGSASAPSIDPFRALIQPKDPVIDFVEKAPVIVPPPPPVIVPPVQFKVTAIAMDGANHVAVVEFENQTYIVQEGSKIPESGPASIEVRTVSEEKIVVLDTRRAQLMTKQIVEN